MADLGPRWDPWGETAAVTSVRCDDRDVRVGDRVRLRPTASADIFDLELRGRTAVVQAIERDFDDRVHLAVVLDDDPGRELGFARQPGHRFFFGVDEVEPL